MKFENKKDLYDGLEIFMSVVNSTKIINNKAWIINCEDLAERFECNLEDVKSVANYLGLEWR